MSNADDYDEEGMSMLAAASMARKMAREGGPPERLRALEQIERILRSTAAEDFGDAVNALLELMEGGEGEEWKR